MRVRVLFFASLHRLWKSWSFWLFGAGMLGYALWEARSLLSWALHDSPAAGVPADYLSSRIGDFSLPVLILMPLLCAVFLNVDYHEHTVRNKLVAGYRRWQIYLANYLTMLTAALIFAAVHILVMTVTAATLPCHVWALNNTAVKLLNCLSYILMVTALFTLLGMAVSQRAVPVIAIFLAVGFLWLARCLFDQLGIAPEHIDWDHIKVTTEMDENGDYRMVYWQDGQRFDEEQQDQLRIVHDPRYVAEPMRSVGYFLLNALPGGQAFRLSDSIAVERGTDLDLALYALLLAGISTMFGLLAFQRKDIK